MSDPERLVIVAAALSIRRIGFREVDGVLSAEEVVMALAPDSLHPVNDPQS
jgi:hypothetical protein